ncbi:PucR family transcriptional regulator [Actinomadura sp. NEAU-AAG7]|uniref:PucR family transcriptional regulator n=1 Tax=Actinomadura sp. NEAU-AAG7 TaxID=2839640 RepID=UPI001BE4DA47|nr:PucR family transcriptional regulator [Actinomadura sp. NEAU-AAG7]MBT2213400.1 PucR family transcriptional regulator ligand-binding domain-containing protein [Actinomadura sp. NEAU-AAG7]
MPPTLAAVAALPQLGLRVLTGPRVPDTPVVWVAVSELEDPTPFLEGGELVLTTGMRLTPAGAARYVDRLVGRGVAGLGFAVGVIHAEVPPELLAAARDRGLVLLEVPRPTPFIAVGKAVSRMLAAEWYEDVTRAFGAQRELTRAALAGPGPLVARLARLLDGWALLLDPSGAVRHAEPAAARDRAGALAADLARLRGPNARPADGALASVALSVPGENIVLQRVGLSGRPRGFLAVGTEAPLPHVAHTIVGAAVALLTLQSEAPRTGRETRAALGALLLGLPPAGPAVPRGPVRVLACAGPVLDALDSDPSGERCLAVPLPGPGRRTAVIVPDDLTDTVTSLLAPPPPASAPPVSAPPASTAPTSSPPAVTGPVGVSDPVTMATARGGELETALQQAEEARSAARRHGRPVLRYADLPGQGLLGLLDPGAARGFATGLLAPLRAEGLVETLRAYVAANGQGEAAARALGVHRHTLRARMRKAAELLDRDPDDPAVRAELWIALAVASSEDDRIGHPGASRSGPPEIA